MTYKSIIYLFKTNNEMFPYCQPLKIQILKGLLDLTLVKPAERGKYVCCVSSWNINKKNPLNGVLFFSKF